jgi:deoxyribonuclease V
VSNTISTQHDWDLSPAEARVLQTALAKQIERQNRLPKQIRRVAGVDVGFEQNGTLTRAAVAVLDYPSLELIEQAIERQPTRFPYIPGLLSFREVPAILAALERLSAAPDLLLCDGQGIAHPRRFGVACHLGLLTGLPSIGVAKSRLIGEHDEVPEEKGQWVQLLDKGETIGAVLRSRTNVRPLYISGGHRVSLQTAIDWTLRCTTRYRLPETTRRADKLASHPRYRE